MTEPEDKNRPDGLPKELSFAAIVNRISELQLKDMGLAKASEETVRVYAQGVAKMFDSQFSTPDAIAAATSANLMALTVLSQRVINDPSLLGNAEVTTALLAHSMVAIAIGEAVLSATVTAGHPGDEWVRAAHTVRDFVLDITEHEHEQRAGANEAQDAAESKPLTAEAMAAQEAEAIFAATKNKTGTTGAKLELILAHAKKFSELLVEDSPIDSLISPVAVFIEPSDRFSDAGLEVMQDDKLFAGAPVIHMRLDMRKAAQAALEELLRTTGRPEPELLEEMHMSTVLKHAATAMHKAAGLLKPEAIALIYSLRSIKLSFSSERTGGRPDEATLRKALNSKDEAALKALGARRERVVSLVLQVWTPDGTRRMVSTDVKPRLDGTTYVDPRNWVDVATAGRPADDKRTLSGDILAVAGLGGEQDVNAEELANAVQMSEPFMVMDEGWQRS